MHEVKPCVDKYLHRGRIMVNNITLLESADKDERNDVFFVRLTGIGEQ